MALQTSGAISINDIATEFGGSTPHSLSEYYGVAAGIPSSGAISLSDFYGASAFTPYDLSLFNLSTAVNDYAVSNTLAGEGLSIGNNGTYLLVGDGQGWVDIYSTSTPYTFNSSTTSYTGQLNFGNGAYYGAKFNSTGTIFYASNADGGLFVYSVSPAFSLNTANYTLSQSYTLPLYLGNQTLEWNELDPSNTVVLSGGRDGFTYPLVQYNLSSAFSLSPAPSFAGIFDTTSYFPDDRPIGQLSGSPGNKLHVWYSRFSTTSPSLVQFALSTNKDITTASHEQSFTFAYPLGRRVNGLAFNPQGDKFYYLYQNPLTGGFNVAEFQP